jgi:hypothetical protein
MALHLESEVPMAVYVSRDKSSDPNQFQNDVTYKQTSKLTLRTNDLEFLQNGYTVTVYVAAIDEHANTLLYNTLRVSFEDSSHPLTLAGQRSSTRDPKRLVITGPSSSKRDQMNATVTKRKDMNPRNLPLLSGVILPIMHPRLGIKLVKFIYLIRLSTSGIPVLPSRHLCTMCWSVFH